jgi:hypothetical protein
MRKINKLLESLAAEEEAFREATFLAPCLPGGKVRARVAGLVLELRPVADFEGWGIFRALEGGRAELVEEAELPQIDRYLQLLPQVRLRLALPLRRRTWLAYPVSESDVAQRMGAVRPVPVHLVSEGMRFEQITSRFDGSTLWFEAVDRGAEPRHAEAMDEALTRVVDPELLRFRGMTPEMRTCYGLAAQQAAEFRAMLEARRDESRLRDALGVAGGDLRRFTDRGEFWLVEWTTRDGERHSSAIDKRQLTVVSSGICLSGRDRDFDLQSLVGVMEGQY